MSDWERSRDMMAVGTMGRISETVKAGVSYHMCVFCSLNRTHFTQWKAQGNAQTRKSS